MAEIYIKLPGDLKRLKEIVSKSKFTEKDAKELSNKVRESMHKDLVKRGLIWMKVVIDSNVLFSILIWKEQII